MCEGEAGQERGEDASFSIRKGSCFLFSAEITLLDQQGTDKSFLKVFVGHFGLGGGLPGPLPGLPRPPVGLRSWGPVPQALCVHHKGYGVVPWHLLGPCFFPLLFVPSSPVGWMLLACFM